MNPKTRPGNELRILLVAIAVVLVALLFHLGSRPFAAGLIREPWDKLAHFAVYGTVAALLRIGIAGDHPWRLVTLVGFVGALDEWHQSSVPGRSADLADLATDVIAAVCAILACDWWATRRAATAT